MPATIAPRAPIRSVAIAPALFVGRTREVTRIKAALAGGKNLVLTGNFGIGRTTLLHRIAMELGGRWRFVFLDGSRTPAQVGDQLLRAWGPQRQENRSPAGTAWKARRSRLSSLPGSAPNRAVLVLDDLAKLTQPKLDFVTYLAHTRSYGMIAVVERFMPVDQLVRLRSALYPSPLIRLGPISLEAARKFFAIWSQRRGLRWDVGHIRGLATSTHGYPLGMWEAARLAELTTHPLHGRTP